MFELEPDEVHLWHAFPHRPPHDRRLDEYATLLNADERAREARFHFAEDRIRFRVTRAMVRRVLAGYLGIAPADCLFENNAHGRPSLVNAQARERQIEFNLSHARDLILLGVTRGRALGVDVERVDGRRATADLARRFFAPFESERVIAATEAERDELFMQFWTLKESYIKAHGKGFAIPLGKFGFRLREQGPALWTDPELQDDASRWAFVQLRPTESHRAAICVERGDHGTPVVRERDFAALTADAGYTAVTMRNPA